MDLPAPFYELDQHIAIDLPGARALFTTRRGGRSTGPYATLNLGRWTEDDRADVEANRASLQERYSVAAAWGRQVHGYQVRCADGSIGPGEVRDADGWATATPGVAPMVLTADCLAIALAGGGAVAMVHAGWRGLAGGIVDNGVAALRTLGGHGPLAAAIGPGAGGCCYEVGEEVHDEFAPAELDLRRGRNLDLKAIAREQLRRAGVETVHDTGLCTICADPQLFFSHRRDHGVTGRQAGLAWLT